MDLHLAVEGSRDLTGQLYRQLRSAVLEGRLRGGDRLPPTRELAERLGISRNVVTEAYDRLTGEGFLLGRVGAGTYIAESVASGRHYTALRQPTAKISVRPIWNSLPTAPIFSAPPLGLPYSFLVGTPERRRFPFDIWRRIFIRELRAFSKSEERGTRQGEPQLRQAIAKYVAFSRAVVCDEQDIVVTNGTQQALDLIGRVLIDPGTVVAVEEPGYPMARASFLSHGARVIGVPVDREGLVVERLPERAKLIFVTPSHQFPLGMPMSLARRMALLEWAQARGAVIIEDDYDSEYRFEGRSLESLQNLDRSGLVLYLGTFSKVLFPGLRLGFVVAPPSVRAPLVKAKEVTDWFSNVLDQATLARFIDDGHLAKHIRKMRKIYAARRQLLLNILTEEFDEWLEPIASVAGSHLSAFLRKGIAADSVVEKARHAGVGIHFLNDCYFSRPAKAGLIIGYGAIEERAIAEGLKRLLNVLKTLSPVKSYSDTSDVRRSLSL
jgi:GntR family transcriptional regulator/MocR family aminotransferase